MSKSVGPSKTTLESDLKKMWSRWTDSLVSCGRKADSCESDAVSKLSGFVWTGPLIAYQSRIAFLVIRLVKCQANGRCFETQRRPSCDDRLSLVDLFFFNFTTIIKRVTNFPFAGSVSEDYRKERLPSTSVGSLHHTEWRYVREL